MENGIVIFYDGRLLGTILVHEIEFKSINQILDIYAKLMGLNRSLMTGRWTKIIDITDIQNGHAPTVGYAKNEWPNV